jgi:hypothetical protein
MHTLNAFMISSKQVLENESFRGLKLVILHLAGIEFHLIIIAIKMSNA